VSRSQTSLVISNATLKTVEEKPYFGTSKIFLCNILLNISSNSDIYRANMNTSWRKLFNDFVMRKNDNLHNSDWMTNETGIWNNLSKKKDRSFNPITSLKISQPVYMKSCKFGFSTWKYKTSLFS